jgi:hypothetical protein
MTDYAGRREELIGLPLDLKLNVTQQIFIRHAGVIRASEVFEKTVLHGLRLREAATGYIIGESRCGKSETAKRGIQKLTGRKPAEQMRYQLIEGNGKKVIYADMTNGATPLEATRHIVEHIFNDVLAHKVKEHNASNRLIDWFQQNEIDLFVIDEGQQLFNGHGPLAATKMGRWLLALENAASFRTIVIGDPHLYGLFDAVPALLERKSGIAHLEPFSFATDIDKAVLGKFLLEFERCLPVRETCLSNQDEAVSPRRLLDVYFASRGAPGGISKLCEGTLVAAYARTNGAIPEKLELVDFIAAFDLLYGADPRMLGVNPFKAASEKDIPTIPYTPDDANRERLSRLGKRRSRRSNAPIAGGRILGA